MSLESNWEKIIKENYIDNKNQLFLNGSNFREIEGLLNLIGFPRLLIKNIYPNSPAMILKEKQITGVASIWGKKQVALTFSWKNHLEFHSELTDISLEHIQKYIIPFDSNDSTALSKWYCPSIQILYDDDTKSVKFSGNLFSSSGDFKLLHNSNIKIDNPNLEMLLHRSSESRPYDLKIYGDIPLSQNHPPLPVQISAPIDQAFWELKLMEPERKFNTFSFLKELVVGVELSQYMPDELFSIFNDIDNTFLLSLYSFYCSFQLETGKLKELSMRIDSDRKLALITPQKEDTIPEVALSGASLTLHMLLQKDKFTLYGSMKVRAKVGDLSLSCSIPIPSGTVIILEASDQLENLDEVTALAKDVSSKPLSSFMPPRFESLTRQVSLRNLKIGIDIKKRTITTLGFFLESATSWSILKNFNITNIGLHLKLIPSQGLQSIVGTLFGTVVIKETPISLAFGRQSASADWSLRLTEAVNLPRLSDLRALISGEITSNNEVIEEDPEYLKKFLPTKSGAENTLPTGLTIHEFCMSFGGKEKALSRIMFDLYINDPWQILPEVFSLESAEVSLDIRYPTKKKQREITGFIKAKLLFVEAEFEVSAQKIQQLSSSDSNISEEELALLEDGQNPGWWFFKGALLPESSLSLSHLVQRIASAFTLNLNWAKDLPEVDLEELELSYQTDESAQIAFKAGIFIGAEDEKKDLLPSISLTTLSAMVDIVSEKDNEGKRTILGLIAGTAQIGGADFHMELDIGKKALASWERGKDQKFDLGSMAKALEIPGDYSTLSLGLKKVLFEYDIEAGSFRLSAEAEGDLFKYAYFMATKSRAETSWDFLFGVDFQTLSVPISKLDKLKIPLISNALIQDIEISDLSSQVAKSSQKYIVDSLPNKAPGEDEELLEMKGVASISEQALEAEEGVTIRATFRWGEKTYPIHIPLGKTNKKLVKGSNTSLEDDSSGTSKWIDVQKSIGPLHVKRVGFSWKSSELWLKIDPTFSLSGLNIDLKGLAIGPISPGKPIGEIIAGVQFPKIDGMDISYESEGISISGGLMKVGDNAFEGECLIQTPSFGLAGLGAYTDIEGAPSVFIYVSMNIPLGGPPYFFIEGFAGGFGFNREIKLPQENKVIDFPLVKHVMGNSAPSSSPGDILSDMKEAFPPMEGQYWLAAGIRFSSFKTIESFALLSIAFGTRLEVALLGLSRMTVPAKAPLGKEIAFAELQLTARFSPEEGAVFATARLSESSYLFDKKCTLTGGFAFAIWYKNEPKKGISEGDFVVTLGGYHPRFSKPTHYPNEPRLALRYQVNDNVTIKGECYFALTPTAVMAGGHLEVLYHAGKLRAWFRAIADFLIQWKPLYYEADVDVSIGASYELDIFGIREVISVELAAEVHLKGPPLHGKARIKWYVLSFTVEFGEKTDRPKALTWDEFKDSFLPSKEEDICGVRVEKGMVKKISDSHFVINSSDFSLITYSAVPSTKVQFQSRSYTNTTSAELVIPPMEKQGANGEKIEQKLSAIQKVTVSNASFAKSLVHSPVKNNVPQALWSKSGTSLDPLAVPKMTKGVLNGIRLSPKKQNLSNVESANITISRGEKEEVAIQEKAQNDWEGSFGKKACSAYSHNEHVHIEDLKALQYMGMKIPTLL